MMTQIKIIQADITGREVDAIVNAANSRMLGGGGVDGAIHRAAGPQLLETCKNFPVVHDDVRVPTGECRVTPGFKLPARFVIHTAGPVWHGGKADEQQLLCNCYRNALHLAVCIGARSLAYPAISCGIYRFPIDLAAKLSVRTLKSEIERGVPVELIELVAFDDRIKSAWETALQEE
jgi:O-acetyl-ADP-ribose deacetylase (regulator of RNase III)